MITEQQALKPYQRAPTWRSVVSDGIGIDRLGRVFQAPDPAIAARREQKIKRRLRHVLRCVNAGLSAAVQLLLDSGTIPGLSADGASPAARATVEGALRRLPRKLLAVVLGVGGKRIEVLPAPSIDWRGSRVRGVGGPAGARIAGEAPNLLEAVLHEFAHVLDCSIPSRGAWWISYSPAWQQIWQRDLAAGRVPEFARQREDAAEYLAECFAAYWGGDGWRLTAGAREFLASWQAWF
jgi:hypothetical protein